MIESEISDEGTDKDEWHIKRTTMKEGTHPGGDVTSVVGTRLDPRWCQSRMCEVPCCLQG